MKEEYEVKTLVDHLEEFIQAIINNKNSSDVADAVILNKKRAALETYIRELAGIKSEAEEIELDNLKCPDCGAEMKLRTNRQNGNKFWGCKRYPDCKGTRDENGLSKAEREEAKYKKEQVSQESGFSFNRDKRSPANEVSPPVDTGWINPFAKK